MRSLREHALWFVTVGAVVSAIASLAANFDPGSAAYRVGGIVFLGYVQYRNLLATWRADETNLWWAVLPVRAVGGWLATIALLVTGCHSRLVDVVLRCNGALPADGGAATAFAVGVAGVRAARLRPDWPQEEAKGWRPGQLWTEAAALHAAVALVAISDPASVASLVALVFAAAALVFETYLCCLEETHDLLKRGHVLDLEYEDLDDLEMAASKAAAASEDEIKEERLPPNF